ncbi:importin subunit alpha-4, putative [Entamoeba invadens IP1]|uniref:Importin subunit alpha-4, putative n=1 Tax=Entamoeba invadens IP1 TaxID=370355 RepID=A0A0A1UE49_ENTIV|nr:importin subunit alpha-4, putative [Entamoeba invadens IP1]ELP94870.1 importin subunit alpha-4, putative [Entamoeba invadens IP1]|eukprot:XP_004261641.1 importin subunit alpha-4, putative [Entamoeba invadens IP1]
MSQNGWGVDSYTQRLTQENKMLGALRSARRVELVSKRRIIEDDTIPSDIPQRPLIDILTDVNQCDKGDERKLKDLLTEIGYFLSRYNNTCINANAIHNIAINIIPLLTQQNTSYEIIMQCLMVLTSITYLPYDIFKPLIPLGVFQVVMFYMKSSEIKIVAFAMIAIANAAVESVEVFDYVAQLGFMDIMKSYSTQIPSKLINAYTFAFKTVGIVMNQKKCRDMTTLCQLTPVAVFDIPENTYDESSSFVEDTLWGISFACDDQRCIEFYYQNNVFKRMLLLLRRKRVQIIRSIIAVYKKCLYNNPIICKHLIENRLLEYLSALLMLGEENITTDTLFLISNLVSEIDIYEMVVNSKIVDLVTNKYNSFSVINKREANYMFTNLLSVASDDCIMALVQNELFYSILASMVTQDVKTVRLLLYGIQKVILVGDSYKENGVNIIRDKLNEAGVVKLLEYYAFEINDLEVKKNAESVLVEYFDWNGINNTDLDLNF